MTDAQVGSAPRDVAADRPFIIELVPALDDSNQRQFRGCLEDWVIDHVKLDVEQLDQIR